MGVKTKIKNAVHTLIQMGKEEKIQPIIVPVEKEKLLNGKVALITGGTSGIGFAIAQAFQNAGAKVIIAGTNQVKLEAALEKMWGIKGLLIDVRDTEHLPDKVKEAEALFEENKIDILVNSAGVVVKHDFWGIDEKEYDGIMDINAKGTFFMSQAVGKSMIEKQVKGHILNVTSSSALRPAWTPYQMSKWAVRGLTLGLADTLLPYGIVVNAIAPEPTATPMLGKTEGSSISEPNNPSKRYAMPEEIASMAVYMVSDAGRMIVGDTVYMTGGSGTITLHH